MDPKARHLYAAAYERRRALTDLMAAVRRGFTNTERSDLEKLSKDCGTKMGWRYRAHRLGYLSQGPNIVYAIVQHEKGGTYRSEDKGETWKKMGDTNPRRRTTADSHRSHMMRIYGLDAIWL